MTRPAPSLRRRLLPMVVTALMTFGAMAAPADAAISRTSKNGRVGAGPGQTTLVYCAPAGSGLFRHQTWVGRVPGVRHQAARARNRLQVWNGARWVRYRVDPWQQGHNVGGGRIYFGELPASFLHRGYFYRVVMEVEWRGRNGRLGRARFLFGNGQYANTGITNYCYIP